MNLVGFSSLLLLLLLQMADSDNIANAKFRYFRDDDDGHHGDVDKGEEAIDTHHIVVRKKSSRAKAFLLFLYLSALLLLANAFFLFHLKEKSITILPWSLLLGTLLVKLLLQEPVERESVVIMPAFGVQLETRYASGRTVHRFVPISKILKPVLNECVTPVTCYWSLSLIVRGEEELMLVFKELRPPLKMLVPIWKALCAATDSKESPDAFTWDGELC